MAYSLNENQQKAVNITEGPLIILAGPGTGKTLTLVSKIEHLVNFKKVLPSEILALTFTNKAANEINERLNKNIKSSKVNSHTFHAFAHKLLTSRGEEFNIISTEDRNKIIENIIKDTGISVKDFQVNISRFKNLAKYDTSLNNISTTILVNKYNEELSKNEFVDFDDFLIKAYKLVEQNEEYRNYLKGKFKYILVDEFQDTNKIQYEFIKLILNESKNLCVIGDPHQSIYAFRGSDPQSFENFKTDFPLHKEVHLYENYRSAIAIQNVSNMLFSDADFLEKNSSEDSNEFTGEVVCLQTLDEYTQAKWILNFINQKIGGVNLQDAGSFWGQPDEKINFSNFAVIYRNHSQNRILKKLFFKSGIPYQVIGEGSIFERKEIIFLVSCFKYISTGTTDDLTEDAISKVKTLKLSTNIIELTNDLVAAFELQKNFFNNSLNELTEFYNLISFYGKHENSVNEFLEFYKNLSENDYYDSKANKVSLLTIHSAKGLEFDYVFIIGFNDGILPNLKEAQYSDSDEEKRLLYVAMTRAKKGLYLITYEESYRKKLNHPSRFLTDIRCDALKIIDDPIKKRIEEKRRKEKLEKSQLKLF